jgi:uncharacterized protein YecT (DUF1311 family)
MLAPALFAFSSVLPLNARAAPSAQDVTQKELQGCLDAPSHTSTAGQTQCEIEAARRYDGRMNAAYTGLMRRLPASIGAQLRSAQRAWLAFRTLDAKARAQLYETRQGTMFVPMQAAASTAVVRDRALQLEAALRVLEIDG